MVSIQPQDATSSTTAESPTISTRHGFANRHLMAARKFTVDLLIHEEQHRGEAFGAAFDDAQWLATAAYIMSYSAVEAWVSETADDLQITEDWWRPFRRKGLLDRCDAILLYREHPPLDRRSSDVQAFLQLKQIRDGLVHPKAEWSTVGVGSRLSRVVLDAQFPLSPFEIDPKDAFPYGCMSAGGAQWAHDTASALISRLKQRMSSPN